MPLYEHVFMARQDVSAQQVEALTNEYKDIVEKNGGSFGKTEYWGLKSLAYKVKKNRKAHFTLINIDAPHGAVAEMERQMRISTDVLRFLTLKVDEHETEPSAMMKKGDRDDRRGGRGGRDGGRDGGRPPRRDGPPRDREPREARAPSEAAPVAEAPAAVAEAPAGEGSTE